MVKRHRNNEVEPSLVHRFSFIDVLEIGEANLGLGESPRKLVPLARRTAEGNREGERH
jgi:hypothetical protein